MRYSVPIRLLSPATLLIALAIPFSASQSGSSVTDRNGHPDPANPSKAMRRNARENAPRQVGTMQPASAAKSANVVIIGQDILDPNCSTFDGANVIINGGCLALTGPAGELGDFRFTALDPLAVSAAALAPYDTAVLNVASAGMFCDTGALTASQKSALVSFVGQGKKLIIYDSECYGPGADASLDYSWLPYPFTTANPGAQGAAGIFTITESDSLTTGLDAALFIQDPEMGDMNVMTTRDSHWCVALSGTDALNITGAVEAYAKYPAGTDAGLFIYDGMDQDPPDGASPALLANMRKIWVNQLQQPFNPSNLPCRVVVVGITLSPAAATTAAGQQDTVTATVKDQTGLAQAGVSVAFNVISGPNTGKTGTGKTNTSGQASYSYTSSLTGMDTIQACFTPAGSTTPSCSATVTNLWTQVGTTVATNPAGLMITVDGVTYAAPVTFTWAAGSSHSISVTSPQTSSGTAGARYAFASWTDSGAQAHNITASASGGSYTANFTTQYLLTSSVSPSGAGSVTASPGSIDGYYSGGASVQLTAAPNSGYAFSNWTGDLSGTANPQLVSMTAPRAVTASFSIATSAVTVATSPSGLGVVVDGTAYTAPHTFTWTVASSHSVGVTSPQAVTGNTAARYVYTNWSDSGAQTHNITVSSSGGNFTAGFTTQYLLTTSIAPSGAGSVTASPGSTDGYYSSGTSVQLTAAPNSGYVFSGWSGDLSGTANPQSVSMTTPRSVTAAFSIVALGTTVATIPSGLSIVADGATYTAPHTFNWAAGTGHTIGVTSPQTTGGSQYTFSSWSDGGAQTHTLTAPATGTYTANFAVASGSGLYFYPVTPCRVADTRSGSGKTGSFGPPGIFANTSRTFPVTAGGCNIPATAAAYSLNVAVVPPAQLTYLTMWPTGQSMPTVSTLNDFSAQVATPGNVVANAAIVPAGSNGSVSVYVSETTDVIIDINGYFAPPGTGGLVFYLLSPCRIADTRGNGKAGLFGPPTMAANSSRSFPVPLSSCSVPSTAQAYSLNMTVAPQGQLTYLTTWPGGQPMPTASTLNDFSTVSATLDLGRAVANAAIVPAGAGGAVSVFVSDATDVIIDINGYFAPPGGSEALLFYTSTPCRVADTRVSSMGAFGAPSLAAGATRSFPIPTGSCTVPSNVQAYSLNMTVVPAAQLTYLTTWPFGQSMPTVSTLNDFSTVNPIPGRVVANAAIVPAGTSGAISVFVSDLTDVIIDSNGYFAP